MRRSYPIRTHRDPAEDYDVIYDYMPNDTETRRLIDHQRKLITVNCCANPYTAVDRVAPSELTCYADELEED